MSEAKYTKGTWYVEGEVVVTDDLEIAFLGGLGGDMTPEMRKANGRLIAASPEMIEALQDAKAWLTESNSPWVLRERIKAAIDKAIGD